jgi:hypothetical protein
VATKIEGEKAKTLPKKPEFSGIARCGVVLLGREHIFDGYRPFRFKGPYGTAVAAP